ncbi:MAG TPA: tRNA glutamyl-Q(34) synthetase GluQRS [Myxococcota bacterium]
MTGRYAPSPTGYLHVGNAFAALLTLARARRRGERCLLRIENLDTPRVMPGAATAIFNDLHALGLHFDPFVADDATAAATIHGVLFQDRRMRAYDEALQRLIGADLVCACRCSRKDLQRAASAPHVGDDGPPYPGTCRDLGLALDAPDTALRVRLDRLVARYGNPDVVDAWQGRFVQDVVADVGDIVVRRKDGLFSYQLAVVVDDGAQGITEVVRGVDLLSSAPRQVLLHQALGQVPPSFAHLPLLIDDDGHRLSKRSDNAPGLVRSILAEHGAPRLLAHLLRLTGVDAGEAIDLDTFIARLDEDALAVAAIPWRPLPAP